MKHKINGAGIAVTGFLIFLLLFIIAVLWSLNVSGPARAYEAKIAAQIEAIHKEHDAIENIERDVFRYVTYIGEDQEMYYWLNEEAQVITTREKRREMMMLSFQRQRNSVMRVHPSGSVMAMTTRYMS